jgi:hypothetical protein
MADQLQISGIRLYNLLKGKYGEKEAEEFVALIKEQVNESFEAKKEMLATKADIAALEVRITALEGKLETKIAQVETRLILWAFVFWATQLAAIFAFIKLLFIK